MAEVDLLSELYLTAPRERKVVEVRAATAGNRSGMAARGRTEAILQVDSSEMTQRNL